MLFSAIIGDWSDDGHGKTETFVLDVEGHFTNDCIKDAYARSKARYGRGLEDVANLHEDSDVPVDWIKQMQDEGLSHLPGDFEWALEYGRYGIPAQPEDLVHILIHMIKMELPDFHAEIVQIPLLAGGFGAAIGTREFIGYGCF